MEDEEHQKTSKVTNTSREAYGQVTEETKRKRYRMIENALEHLGSPSTQRECCEWINQSSAGDKPLNGITTRFVEMERSGGIRCLVLARKCKITEKKAQVYVLSKDANKFDCRPIPEKVSVKALLKTIKQLEATVAELSTSKPPAPLTSKSTKVVNEDPKLEIQNGKDGVWLHFHTSNKLHASLNLHTQNISGIIGTALSEWSKEYAFKNPVTEAALPAESNLVDSAG